MREKVRKASKFFERCRYCTKLLIKGQRCPYAGMEDHRQITPGG